MKEYSIYKNSDIRWIGQIPESWRLIQLKFLTENHDNKRIPVTAEDRGKCKVNIPIMEQRE